MRIEDTENVKEMQILYCFQTFYEYKLIPAGIYLFKGNNGNPTEVFAVNNKATRTTPVASFLLLVFHLLNLNKYISARNVTRTTSVTSFRPVYC